MAILTRLDEPALAAFAATYALGELVSARGVEAGTVNTSYALTFARGRYFLRLYEEQDAAGAAREARLLDHLACAGVPTPPPLADRDGSLVKAIDGKPAVVFPWIDGDMICQRGVTAARAEKVGEAIARVHLAGPIPGFDEGRFSPAALVARCDRIALSRDQEARASEHALRDAVSAVAGRRAALPSGLVHGDLFRDNVLWHEDKIAALLDFESAHLGPFAYDLAVTILSWSFGDTFDAAIARAITRGYERVRTLVEAERAALFDECILGCLRFTITRITDEAIRVGKRWQRFVTRREALEELGPRRFRELVGL